MMSVDLQVLGNWLEGRSLARGLPNPVPDFGGFRIDTRSEEEICRWIFADAVPGIPQVAKAVSEPRYLVKLCGMPAELASLLPDGWRVEQTGCFMSVEPDIAPLGDLPSGYWIDRSRNGAVNKVEIRDANGGLAASGYAAETGKAFVYDRIQTDVKHRRRGLGRAVVAALRQCRSSTSARQLLVATLEGEKLYASLGWNTVSPYSTAEFAPY